MALAERQMNFLHDKMILVDGKVTFDDGFQTEEQRKNSFASIRFHALSENADGDGVDRKLTRATPTTLN